MKEIFCKTCKLLFVNSNKTMLLQKKPKNNTAQQNKSSNNLWNKKTKELHIQIKHCLINKTLFLQKQ